MTPRNSAMLNGAMIALGALAIIDNVLFHWVLQVYRAGNTYMREVAEQDPDLQRAIEKAEKDAQRPQEEKDQAPANVDTVAEQQRDLRNDEAERQPNENDAREAHELASTVDATNRLQDRIDKDKEAAQRGGETTRTDPAQQHIPRLEELEREEMDKRERDRDDRER